MSSLLCSKRQRQDTQSPDMYSSKQCVVRTNKVAPVIIKDCREEFQQFLDLNEPIVNGSLAEGMSEHPLIKGKFLMVQDRNGSEDRMRTYHQIQAPNFYQPATDQPVFSSGQPTVNGLNKILNKLTSDSQSEIIVLNLRSEPVLFQRVDDDYVPYSVRHREHIHNMVVMGDTKESCDHIEACIRKEIVSLASMEDEFVFYFYDNLRKLHQEPHIRKVEFEEDIRLSAEVYAREAFSNRTLSAKAVNNQKPSFKEGEFIAVQKLVSHLNDGFHIKYQVDTVIDQCSEVINLRTSIADHKDTIKSVTSNHIINGSSESDCTYMECVSALKTYCFLISFNAYLHSQMPNNLCWTYAKWLHHNPEVIYLCNQVNYSELCAPTSLLSSQQRFLVCDDYIGLDVLSTHVDVKVSNFHRLMGLPVYGMAQPTRNGLSKVVNHLLHQKQSYSNVVVINLRSDYVLECDDVTYSVRDSSFLAEPIYSQCSSGKEIEEMEQKLKKEIKFRRKWKVYTEITDPPVEKELISVFTPEELFEQQRLSTLDLHYRRLPLQYDHGLREQEFDAIQNLILSFMKESGSWTQNYNAFVFHCRTGKSRTSLAMAVAGLLFYHMTGFPYGANPDEQERVSCPNARYTKGEFLVVEKLVWMLPEGHQVKREVDLILDRLFETMSPMHFHLREVIFVTFNKSKSRTGPDQKSLLRLSYDLLERYMYLILYNAYLHMEKSNQFQLTFSQWMIEVAATAGVYELLDNLGFFTLETSPSEYSRIKNRIIDRQQTLPFTGVFI